jgi:hypothetical protein
MPVYRFYRITHDGHVDGPPIVWEGPADATALNEAKQYVDGFDIEVWQDARRVAYLTPGDPQKNVANE